MNCLTDSGEFQEVESNYSGEFSHVPSQPVGPRAMSSRDRSVRLDTWNLPEPGALGAFTVAGLNCSTSVGFWFRVQFSEVPSRSHDTGYHEPLRQELQQPAPLTRLRFSASLRTSEMFWPVANKELVRWVKYAASGTEQDKNCVACLVVVQWYGSCGYDEFGIWWVDQSTTSPNENMQR